MPKQAPSNGRGARVSGSVITGLLLVPATAIAAVAIVGMTSRPPAAEALEGTTTTEQVEEEAIEAVAVDINSLSDDEALEEACTESAEELLERELDGSISDIETAALDALRQICEEHGMPIAGPPGAEPIVQVITVKASPEDSTDDYSDHDEYEDDEYEDDEYEDDDHDEDDEDDYEDEEDDEDEDEEDDEDEDEKDD